MALNCQIAPYTKWDRKQYYYPDLPKGYQISQYDLPFSHDGWLEISDPKGRIEPKRIGIIRAHLEEDAGKSMHDEQAGEADSRIDLNRAGTPLLEIVSQPDMRSPAEAKAYLTELKLLLTYLGVSDCNMQEGSLRVDANVNLHVANAGGKPIATPIVEVKNMNSFRAVERAMAYEAERQFEVWKETGQRLGDVPKQTSGWDDVANVTRAQRHKEESSDYRYFPDPDLVPVTVSRNRSPDVRRGLGELPADLRRRLEQTYGITPYDSDVIVNQGEATVDYYLALAQAAGDGKLASNWLQQDVLRTLKEQSIEIAAFPISAAALGELLQKVKQGEVDTSARPRSFHGHARRRPVRRRSDASRSASNRWTNRRWSIFAASWWRRTPSWWPMLRAARCKPPGHLSARPRRRTPTSIRPASAKSASNHRPDELTAGPLSLHRPRSVGAFCVRRLLRDGHFGTHSHSPSSASLGRIGRRFSHCKESGHGETHRVSCVYDECSSAGGQLWAQYGPPPVIGRQAAAADTGRLGGYGDTMDEMIGNGTRTYWGMAAGSRATLRSAAASVGTVRWGGGFGRPRVSPRLSVLQARGFGRHVIWPRQFGLGGTPGFRPDLAGAQVVGHFARL